MVAAASDLSLDSGSAARACLKLVGEAGLWETAGLDRSLQEVPCKGVGVERRHVCLLVGRAGGLEAKETPGACLRGQRNRQLLS